MTAQRLQPRLAEMLAGLSAADIAGRSGGTLYRVVEGCLRQEIMIDPRIYEYLGFQAIAVRDHRSQGLDRGCASRRGQILGRGGTVESGVVDEAGRRP